MNSRWKQVSSLAAGVLVAALPAAAELTDTAAHTPTNYYGFQPPAEGGSYTDPVFGTTIRRLSDALSTPDSAGGSSFLTWVMTEYSTMSAWNSGSTRFILQHGSYFALYDGTGSYLRDLPFEIHAGTEPRWSRTVANRLYYVNGNQLKRFDVDTSATATVHTFGEYGAISGHAESDIGFSADRFVLSGDNRDIFVYDVPAGAKGPVLNTAGLGGFDGLYLTPDDNVLITWLASGSGRYRGVELYNRNMGFLRQLATVAGHLDVTRDTDGSEVMVWANSSDPAAICANGVVKVKLATGAQQCLLSLDWSLAFHVGCPDGNGYCYVDTYAPGDPNPSQFWPAYTDELLAVPLGGGATRRLGHHRSRPLNGYNYQPRPTPSRDGAHLIFSSNFGLQAMLGLPTEYSDAYVIDFAPGSGGGGSGGGTGGGGTSGGGTGSAGTFQESSAAITYSGAWYPNAMAVHSGGSATLSMDAGARARFSFSGTGVRWIGYRDPWSGKARVWLDGAAMGVVDTYSASIQAQAVMFEKLDLVAGSHTLEVEVLGQKRSASGGLWVWIDAFESVDAGGGGDGGGGGGGGVLILKDGFETGGLDHWFEKVK